MTEQISSYHFPVGENMEVNDSEEGEQEKEGEEKEKKEFVIESYGLTHSSLDEHIKNRDDNFSKLLIAHIEIFTPPPKS